MTTDCYYDADRNKDIGCSHLGKSHDFKNLRLNNSGYCKFCGSPIIFKLRELSEIQRHNDSLSWKRVLIKRWWVAFNGDQPNLKHTCKEQRKHLQGAAA
jgi:hypothetical protein